MKPEVGKYIERILKERGEERVVIPELPETAGIVETLRAIYEGLSVISKKLDDLTNLIDFGLPNSDRWRWVPIKHKNVVIPPGRRFKLYEQKGSGYIYSFIASVSNPDLRMLIDVGADNRIDIDESPRELYNMGLTGTNQGYFQVTLWDETNDIYVVGYSPIGLGVPFTGVNRAEIINPTDTPGTIYFMTAWLLMTRW